MYLNACKGLGKIAVIPLQKKKQKKQDYEIFFSFFFCLSNLFIFKAINTSEIEFVMSGFRDFFF